MTRQGTRTQTFEVNQSNRGDMTELGTHGARKVVTKLGINAHKNLRSKQNT